MDKTRAAMQQALEALENYGIDGTKSVGGIKCTEAITALREALAEQAEQKPVAYLCPSFVDNFATGRYETCEQKDYGAFPVYAAPVRTKDLTDEEIFAAADAFNSNRIGYVEFARAVIAADREKNK